MKKAWNRWTKFTKRLALSVANGLLAIAYVLLIIPIGWMLQTFFSKTLLGHMYSKQQNTFWSRKQKRHHDMHFAKEQ